MQDYFITTNNCKMKKLTLVKFITIIGNACLVENVQTKERAWARTALLQSLMLLIDFHLLYYQFLQ